MKVLFKVLYKNDCVCVVSIPQCSLHSTIGRIWGEESKFVKILLVVPLQIINPNSNLLVKEKRREGGKDRERMKVVETLRLAYSSSN